MPEVDAIVVNWNGREQTPVALDSLLALAEVRADPQLVRITVSDNGSADGSVGLLRKRYGSRVEIIENRANLGFGAGANRAIAQTAAPFIFLLNPDAAVKDGALAALLAFMHAHPRCAIAGPKIFTADGRVAESCGEFDTWIGAFLRSSGWGDFKPLRRFANGASLRTWDYDSERRVDLVIGAALLVRRSVIEKTGTFDERYFMYHEEVDLARRVADAGFESWFVPQAQATHTGMGSSGGKNVERWKTRSRRMYWVKHHGRVWYYALGAALVARYVLYAGALALIAAAIARAIRSGH
ncbi:MAG: glycosyltransferase family 2 protein [Candidatus Baltobacteraceae bacterium]